MRVVSHHPWRQAVILGAVIALCTGGALAAFLFGRATSELDQSYVRSIERLNDANLAIPIMMAHGTQDPMIPIMRAATSRENLVRLGYDVRWYDYPMGHQVCMEEIEQISAFFQEVLPI